MDYHGYILCTPRTQCIHNTILNSAKLIMLPHFVKYLNYAGYIPHIIHYMAPKPLSSLNASSTIKENYYTQQWNSALAIPSVLNVHAVHINKHMYVNILTKELD